MYEGLGYHVSYTIRGNQVYEGTGYLDGDRHFAGAIYAGQSLNIELNGDSELVNTRNDENSVYDIIVMGKLSISGTGTLTAKANKHRKNRSLLLCK